MSKAIRLILSFWLFAVVSSASWAGDFEDNLEKWEKAAEKGDVSAQNTLAFMYYGVLQDYKEAAKWWRFAAQQGDASAQLNLGNMYDRGEGVIQDKKEAVKWYRLSSE